jgi:hypothetical protein
MRFSTRAVAIVAASLIAVTATAQRAAFNLTGTWLFAVVTENGTGTPTVTIKQVGDSLSGTYESARMGTLPFKGAVKDSTFQFAIATEGGANLTFKGTIRNSDNIEGVLDMSGMGSATFKGTRKKAAEQ